MSGTSRDGIDAAIVWTDGRGWVRAGPSATLGYDPAFRESLADACRSEVAQEDVVRTLTDRHIDLIKKLVEENSLSIEKIDVIGFHGHTIWHRPHERRTCQIGDAERLAGAFGVPVVSDFRSADVALGGQGAPLAPAYHVALARGLVGPVAVLNLGGVANVTWIDTGGDTDADIDGATIRAFDTGPGNSLIDDWMAMTVGRPFDADGALAASGKVSEPVLRVLMASPYFDKEPPKSLDRGDFDLSGTEALGPADGAATLTMFTAEAVAAAERFFPAPPVRWLVTGGGRHNRTLMRMLRLRLNRPVEPVEAAGWRGDSMEAEAFAYLAVRSLEGLPLSWPTTTGVPAPSPGGRVFYPHPSN
jgi:anhydro-N-acetylmuramic acid kinase